MTFEEAEQHLEYCDSYTRLSTLIDLSCYMDDKDWLKLLGENWINCDNISEYIDCLMDETAFGCIDGNINEMMSKEEQDVLYGLPDLVTIYRGCYKHNKWGLCWTLDIDIAKIFPFQNRYTAEGQPLLVKAVAKKEFIKAVKLDRNEAEIITFMPKHISTSHIRKLMQARQ